jgi:hypothetical protein
MVIDSSNDDRVVNPHVFEMAVSTADPNGLAPQLVADSEKTFRILGRPATSSKIIGHKLVCPVLGQRPIRLPPTSLAGSRGYTHFCFCGLFWAEEER